MTLSRSPQSRWCGLALAVSLLSATAVAQITIHGTVTDASGAAVAGATATSDCGPHSAKTDDQGKFTLPCSHLPATLVLSAEGFARQQQRVSGDQPVVITLHPAGSQQTVTVTGTLIPQSVSESAVSITSFDERELRATPQPTLDDTLRNVAGFSLFRRSGSRIANPTSQGVSFRGIGASGASRALVLFDGVPLNDPFGGWVYWSRIDPEVVSSIEVLQGGGSDIYGDQALSGVVNVFREPVGQYLRISTEGGTLDSFSQIASGGAQLGSWGYASGFFDLGATGGYVLVPDAVRGVVDMPANARHSTGELRLERKFARGSAFVSGSGFGERRHNGSPLQSNDTSLFQITAGFDQPLGGGNLSARLDGSGQSYNQSFSSIAANRATETTARLQHVPAQQFGARVTWLRQLRAHAISAGADSRWLRGATHETVYVGGAPLNQVVAGGAQNFTGAFIQDTWRMLPRLSLGAALRLDSWRDYDASSRTTSLSTQAVTLVPFADRHDLALDPRVSLVFHPVAPISLFATGYRSFRAPRLNELYRAFRVGNVLTLSNSALQAERLTGADAGIGGDWGGMHARATFFFERVTSPITNVTLGITPALITRQRQNVGALESRGLQTSFWTHLGRRWTVRGDYQFADARITRFAPDPTLVDKRVPQVPQHSFAGSVTYAHAGWTAVANGRYAGRQFDDDLNRFDLGSASSLDVYGARRWNHYFETYIAGENLLDSRDRIALTPTPNLSLPRTVRLGLRITLGTESSLQ